MDRRKTVMTDFLDAAALGNGLPPRKQPANAFSLLRVAQRQRHDGLNGLGKPVTTGGPPPPPRYCRGFRFWNPNSEPPVVARLRPSG